MVASINPKTKKEDPGSPTYIVPVLGGQPGVRLDYASYFYTDNDGNQVPIFGNYPAEYIEMTTGTYSGGYLALNTSPKLQALIGRFNEVYASLSRYIQKSSVIDGQAGINAFEVISMTRMLQIDTSLTHARPVYRRGNLVYKKTQLRDGESQGYIVATSMQPFGKVAYQGLQSFLIMPEFQVYPVEAPSGVVTPETVKVFACEPYSKVLASPAADSMFAMSRANLIEKFASLCVSQWGTQENEVTQLLSIACGRSR